MPETKKPKLSVKYIVDWCFGGLGHLMGSIDFSLENGHAMDERNAAQAHVYLDLLDKFYDMGYAYTKADCDFIVKSKKTLLPDIYKDREPRAGSYN